MLELEQDVLEELQRDALRLGEPLALDRLAVVVRRRARAPRAPRSRPWLRSASASLSQLGSRMAAQLATISRSLIDLQSHSTVSDGQLEPGDVARAAAEAGVTVMSLTDHDGVAGVEEATAVAAELGITNVPAVEMSCVHRYSEDLHICGYWVDLERIAPGLRQRLSRSGSTGPRRSSPTSTRHGVEVTFEDAVAQAGAADAIGRPHIAKAAGAGPDLGPFFEEYLVPGAKAFVSRKWPTRRAGGRDHPRRRRRRRRRPSLLGRQGPRAGPRPGREPRPRRRPRRDRDLLPAAHRRADQALPRALRGVRPRPHRAPRTSTAPPTRPSAAGAPTTPTASASPGFPTDPLDERPGRLSGSRRPDR